AKDINMSVQSDDGWGDAAAENAERLIKGTLLKFADWIWSKGKEGTRVEEGTTLIALYTTAAWVKWSDGKPVAYKIRQSGKRLPERSEVGDDDARDWEAGSDGKPKDPWQNTRFVHLVDPITDEEYTFSTSTWGGRGAVTDLADQIQRERYARPGVVPVVELRAAPMLTRFGRKSRPLFKIVDWRLDDVLKPGSPKKGDTENFFDTWRRP